MEEAGYQPPKLELADIDQVATLAQKAIADYKPESDSEDMSVQKIVITPGNDPARTVYGLSFRSRGLWEFVYQCFRYSDQFGCSKSGKYIQRFKWVSSLSCSFNLYFTHLAGLFCLLATSQESAPGSFSSRRSRKPTRS